jgi:superoxide dismutase
MWGWLVYDKITNTVRYYTTFNNDPDLITEHDPTIIPLVNVDIWGHAYYIDFKEVGKPGYL